MSIPNEIEQKADKLINWIRIEIGRSFPEYDSDVVDEMVLVVIRKARRVIENNEIKVVAAMDAGGNPIEIKNIIISDKT